MSEDNLDMTSPDFPAEAPPAEWQEAMSALVERCAAAIPDSVLRYLREARGLTEETISKHRLGYNPQAHKVAGRWWIERGITIPTFYGGALWRVNVRRRADDMRDGRGKYMAAQGSQVQLFNGDMLTDPDIAFVFVFTGEFESMLAQQHAPPAIACVTYGCKSQAPTREFDRLTRGKTVIVVSDNDPSVEQPAQAWAKFGEPAHPPVGKDLTDSWRAGIELGPWLFGMAMGTWLCDPKNQAELLAFAREHRNMTEGRAARDLADDLGFREV